MGLKDWLLGPDLSLYDAHVGLPIKHLIAELKKETTDREFDLLCDDNTLVHIKLHAEKREAVRLFLAICKITAIDGEDLPADSVISERLQQYDDPPNNEDIEALVRRTVESAGISTERMTPVTERYIVTHRRLSALRKQMTGGGG